MNNAIANRIHALLNRTVSVLDVSVLGVFVHATCHCEASARKAAMILGAAGFQVLKIHEVPEHATENRNTVLRPTLVWRWRVHAKLSRTDAA